MSGHKLEIKHPPSEDSDTLGKRDVHNIDQRGTQPALEFPAQQRAGAGQPHAPRGPLSAQKASIIPVQRAGAERCAGSFADVTSHRQAGGQPHIVQSCGLALILIPESTVPVVGHLPLQQPLQDSLSPGSHSAEFSPPPGPAFRRWGLLSGPSQPRPLCGLSFLQFPKATMDIMLFHTSEFY